MAAEEIVKPRSDRREYRRIVLPNSLEALLISDPETDKAAASMNVAVGSYHNPEGLEGLAHFLEHMLFYASEKYPQEGSYMKFVSEHGGSSNAFTAAENTNFHFDVNTDSFEEALDRFSQFFINPSMSPDATSREINAVDSENQKNLLSDGWRIDQLQKHLSSKDHPYHKFGTGNMDTLDAFPKSKGIDIREELIKFYKESYSASLMHLVVYGKGSLDEVQNLVENKFYAIPNTGRNRVRFKGHPCKLEHLQIVVKAIPIKQGHKLTIVWPTTPSLINYKEGPSRYLGHLTGHEGEGSLFFALKTLGWAMSLYAGEVDQSDDFSFFSVVIELTDAGHDHVEDIIGLLFRYVSLLQRAGAQRWIFDELVAISETRFHYQDKVRPLTYVVRIASNMQGFAAFAIGPAALVSLALLGAVNARTAISTMHPPEDWLVGSLLPSKFNPDIIQAALDEITPSSVRIFWESNKFEGCTSLVEPWYKTSYSVEKISCSDIQKWIEAAPAVHIGLPSPNIFIPTDLAIKEIQEKVTRPILLRKSSFSRLWFKPDNMFFIPKVYVRANFSCLHSNDSPEASVLTDIFTRLLVDYLNEYAYDAEIAGLNYDIHQTDTGFQVFLFGYNHKMRILLAKIIERICNFKVKSDRFAVIKETVTKKYENFKFHQPYQQAFYYLSLLLKDCSWPWIEKLEVLPHLDAESLAKFYPRLLSKAFLECYVAGNIQPNEAESLVEHIEAAMFMGSQPISKLLLPSQHLARRIIKIQKALSYFYPVDILNPSDENSALIYYIQVHQDDVKMNVKLQLFALIAKEPTFHQLRSVEQLGYITVLLERDDSGIRGLQFIIQSTVKDPSQLSTRVDAFLEIFERKLYEMTAEEYQSNVNALIDVKLEKQKNLGEESGFYWREIDDGTLRFDRKEAEVAALRELTQQELTEFYNIYVKVGSPERKALSVQVYGGRHSAECNMAKGEANKVNRIDDVFSFRRSRPLYGSLKGGIGQMKL